MIPRRNFIRSLKKAIEQPEYALDALVQRGKSFLSYYFQNGTSAYPETISFLLTYRCNLRCKMCGQWGESGSSKKFSAQTLNEEISLDLVKGVIDEVKGFKPNITLFGGEPFMHQQCLAAASYIKEAGLRCNIITNGTLLEKFAEPIVKLGIDEIIFSLDGPRDIHDNMRNAKGTFDKAMKGLGAVAEAKRQFGSETPLVNISSTLFETNYKYLDDIVEAAEKIEAKSITFHHLIFLSRKIYEQHNLLFDSHFKTRCDDWGGFVRDSLPQIEVKYLIAKIAELKNRDSKVGISFYPNFSDPDVERYYTDFDFVPTSYKNRCVSPWMVAYIFPDGTVRPCQSLNYSSGNLKENGFKKIWNNENHIRFRQITKRLKRYPVCSRCTEFYRF